MYVDSKDLAMRTISYKFLADKTYGIAINSEYGGCQGRLSSMVYKFFNKKTESRVCINEVLVRELHKPVIKELKRRKFFAKFKDNIWAADLIDMESWSSDN